MPISELLDFIVHMMPFVTGIAVPVGIVGLVLRHARLTGKQKNLAEQESEVAALRDELNALRADMDERFADLTLMLDTPNEHTRLESNATQES